MDNFEQNGISRGPESTPEDSVTKEASEKTEFERLLDERLKQMRDSRIPPEPEESEQPEPKMITEETAVPAEPEQPVKVPKGKKILKRVIAGVLILALTAAGAFAGTVWVNFRWADETKRNEQIIIQLERKIAELEEKIQDNSYTGNGNSISGTPNTSADGGLTPAQVYARNIKSVVAISSTITTGSYGQISQSTSAGSGFILSQDGYVVTNYHVVEGATSMKVTTYDETQYEAKLVGYDSANDIAVLKIEAQGLQPAVIGSSDDLIVGDQVAAIGNPLGELTSTLTVGYISAINRDITTEGTVINMLQTDAAINSGNSGGPLFNMKGEVIGITTAKYSGTTPSGAAIEGIGFAIPIDDVIKKITDLQQYGYITGAYLGVSVRDVDRDVAEYYGIPMGVYVADVVKGYCAYEAGVRAKDIIVALGDYEITCLNDLSKALGNYAGGDITTITVWRSGVEITLEITLDAKPMS